MVVNHRLQGLVDGSSAYVRHGFGYASQGGIVDIVYLFGSRVYAIEDGLPVLALARVGQCKDKEQHYSRRRGYATVAAEALLALLGLAFAFFGLHFKHLTHGFSLAVGCGLGLLRQGPCSVEGWRRRGGGAAAGLILEDGFELVYLRCRRPLGHSLGPDQCVGGDAAQL